MKFEHIFAIFLFVKNAYGSSQPPPPPPPDYSMIFSASQHNTDHISNILSILQTTINGQLSSIVDILNAILSATPGIGKRTISQNTLGINRRTLSDKLDNIGSTFTDTNSKSSATQDSLNTLNGVVDSLRGMSDPLNGKTDEIKGRTEEINRRLTEAGSSSNYIIDRIRSTKDNTNLIKTRTNSAGAMFSDPDRKIDVLQRLADSLNALANVLAQRISLLTRG